MYNKQSVFRENRYMRVLNLFVASFGAYKWHLVLIAVMGFVSSFLEGVGVSAVIPAFSFVNGQGGAATDYITEFIRGVFVLFHVTYTFQTLLVFIGVLFVSRILLLFVIQYATARIVFGYEKNLRNELFSLTAGADWAYLSKQKVGYLDQLLITNTTNASQFFGFVSTSVLIFTKTIAYILVAINVSPLVAAVTFIIGGLAFLFFKPFFHKNKILSGGVEVMNRRLAHFVSQHIAGMKTIKSFFVEAQLREKAEDYFESMRRSYIHMMVLRNTTDMLLRFIGVGLIGVIFVFLYKTPGFNIAIFVVIVYAVNQLFTQIQSAQTQLHAFSMMIPYLTSAVNYRNEVRAHAEEYAGLTGFEIDGTIEFDQVSFSHADRDPVLSDVSFTIPRGGMIGIVGPSGSGKTTVVDLLLRLYEVDSGAVRMGGRDIREYSLGEWRKHIGYVTQDAFLINDTIKNNILFYSPATDQDVFRAARVANIHDFIVSLPDGYDTVVGDRGILLSGGQRQRIALARALLSEPKLLVLDEATSALDAESERAVRTAIENLRGKVTVLFVAHRLSTVANVDTIVVIDKGRVVESGKPETLLKDKKSYFYKMYNLTDAQ